MQKLQFEIPENCEMKHFVIKGQFPTLNEYIAQASRHPKAGGRLKKQYMDIASWEIRSQLRGYVAKPPVIVHFVFYEPNMKRDKDNIASYAQKVIFDSLQACGVLKNDGWKDVENFTHDYFVDKNNPRIEVYIEEITNDEMSFLQTE